MTTHARRYACSALLIGWLVTLLLVATGVYALTLRPTTLTGILAVRIPRSGCHAPTAVASTGTLTVVLQSDHQRHISLQVARTRVTGPNANQSPGNAPVSITTRQYTVVDSSWSFHRSVERYRFGMLWDARVNLPC